jgi:hypothetical protein
MSNDLRDLLQSYIQSPLPSFKVSNYFNIYVKLFAHLRSTPCTFIETGILNGGSLFMWRNWLGKDARIIGIDLNPAALKWREHGFEIYIGDQGDRQFWRETLEKIGPFDVLLDDGGHQSFQQIVTVSEAMRVARKKCLIVIEDTLTSFMKEFSRHRDHTFLEYAKATTDNLLGNMAHLFPGEFPAIDNPESVKEFEQLYSVEFFTGMVAFKMDPGVVKRPELCWNKKPGTKEAALDFRYEGLKSAEIAWPSPFLKKNVTVVGGPAR